MRSAQEGDRAMRPSVSVVMSVQDAGEYLAPTMESVLSQEGVDLELVAVDDGSADGSADVLGGFADRDPRVRVLRQERLGLTEALVLGCSRARGRYIARQDAADLSRPGRLARQARALDDDPELAFVSCWTEYRGPRMEYLYTTRDTGVAREPADVVVEEGGKPTLADGPTFVFRI